MTAMRGKEDLLHNVDPKAFMNLGSRKDFAEREMTKIKRILNLIHSSYPFPLIAPPWPCQEFALMGVESMILHLQCFGLLL